MDEFKYYSELERYEIINLNDGDKYNCLGNNDLLIDDDGYFKGIVIEGRGRLNLFGSGGSNYLEIPWENVKKIGLRTIIIDSESIYEEDY